MTDIFRDAFSSDAEWFLVVWGVPSPEIYLQNAKPMVVEVRRRFGEIFCSAAEPDTDGQYSVRLEDGWCKHYNPDGTPRLVGDTPILGVVALDDKTARRLRSVQ